MTIAAATAAPAWADCTPDPTVQYGTTVCTGVDADGLAVSTYGTTVRVDAGAEVMAGDAEGAITSTQYVTGIINGSVAGGIHTGLVLRGGGNVTIAAGASVTGEAAIRGRYGYSGQSFITVNNSGVLSGSTAAALVGDTNAAFSVSNSATGTIAGIEGRLSSLMNAGLIDGGSRSAIAAGNFAIPDSTLLNASGGTIQSANSRTSIDVNGRYLINEGLISNSGTGAAISLYNTSVENRAGARIVAAGGTAISGGALRLVNAGTIAGSVDTTAQGVNADTVDTVTGTIQGDVLLGQGDDTLVALVDLATGRVYGVTGRVDGGDGTDTVSTIIGTNTTISAVTLPTNFERLQLSLANNATAQLANGSNVPPALSVGGYGTFRVLGDVTTAGPAFGPGATSSAGTFTFENQGSITANLTNSAQTAVELTAGRFTNSGRITANGGDAVRVGAGFSAGNLVNSGTITASGTGLTASSYNGPVANSGGITSTGGVAVKLSNISGALSPTAAVSAARPQAFNLMAARSPTVE